MSKGTIIRNFRVADELWTAAREKAESDGRNVSDVLREALTTYTRVKDCGA
jgi:hypothetical protein